MRIALVMLFLFIGVGAFAESRQAPPVNQNTIQNKESKHYYQPPNEITEQHPLFIKIVPAPKSDKEAKTEENERTHKTNIELWTVGTSVATAIILVLQLFVFGRQARLLRETVEATEKAAAAAKKQAEVATQEFISSHRPKLIVRNVTIKPYDSSPKPIEVGKPIQVEWVVANIGSTPANIIESNATILAGGAQFHARTPYSSDRDTMNGTQIVQGGAFTFTIQSPQVDIKNAPCMVSLVGGGLVIYFFGFIMYRDEIGHVRRTAFCRQYSPHSERFTPVDNPDYEYVD